MPTNCLFCRIVAGELPAEVVFENESFIAIRDIQPVAPVHVIVIPRTHYDTVANVEDVAILGGALAAARETANALGMMEEGYRLVINTRENGGQTVGHLHIHVLGGRFMGWPPG